LVFLEETEILKVKDATGDVGFLSLCIDVVLEKGG
jgi:hypothetical protein